MEAQIRSSHRPAGDQLGELPPTPVPPLPAWVAEFSGVSLRHVTAQFDGVRGMDILTFQQRVFEAYQTVFEEIEARAPSQPVRFWAFLPGIHDDLGAGLDRYMAFNAGRYGAFAAHFGRPTVFGRSVPTASAVGVQGNQFVLHCLAAAQPGAPVENPRQVPAYHYSRRFGPMPPCFARATLLRGESDEPLLIVGGTASITGEESRHIGDVQEQSRETLRNLGSVVASAVGGTLPEDAMPSDLQPFLATFRELRIYHPRAGDGPAIAALVQASFPSSCRVELLQALLCRPELLIEIEGLAMPGRRLGDWTGGQTREP
jgi:chorismate lyase/3-hydroxybenzoate synthase